MHARTWLLASCAAMAVIAGSACNNKGTSPVAPDDFTSGASSGSNPSTNAPPVITSLTASPPSILISEASTLSARVADADGDSVTCTWSLDSGGGEIAPGDNTCTAVLRPTQTGTLRVRVQARDSRGATSSARTVEVAVGLTTRPVVPRPDPDPGPKPTPNPNPNPSPSPSPTPDPNPSPSPTPIPPPTVNHAPVVSITAAPASCAAPCAVKVHATASDADGDPLTLTFGGCASGTVQGTSAESECQILNFAEVIASVTATDPSGAIAQASVVIEGQPSQNHPPSVTLRTSAESCHPRPGAPCHITFTAQASDIDPGDTVTYAWSGCTSGSAGSAECVVSAPQKFTGSVTVRDRSGASSSATVLVQGVNRAPDGNAASSAAGCHPYPGACQVNVNATGSDADGDPLSYTWSGCAGADGTAATCTIPALATQSQAANVNISDGWASVTRSVLVGAQNRQPNVEASGGSSCHPRPGQPCTVPVAAVASDPDGDPVTLTWFDCASGSGSRGTCRVETLGPTLATATARDVFGAQRLASVTSYGVNVVAHAIASPRNGSGASATYTLSWSDDDGDIVTCQLTSSDARCEWQACSVGGSANGTRQCDLKVASGTRPGSLVCELRLSCRDEWNHGNDAVFQHTY